MRPSPTSIENQTFPSVSDAVTLESVGTDRFTAPTPRGSTSRLFGGLIVAQSVRAASATAPSDSLVHSVHTSFLRPGRTDHQLSIDVERIHEGRTFHRRLVVGRQDGEAVFTSLVSLYLGKQFASEADARTSRPPIETDPDELPDYPSALDESAVTAGFQLRPVAGPSSSGRPSLHPVWIRHRQPPMPDDAAIATAALAFISDFGLAKSARWDRADPTRLSTTSLDHALWIHRQPTGNPWLLLSSAPRWRSDHHCLIDADLRTTDGDLVASISQEVLVRSSPSDPLTDTSSSIHTNHLASTEATDKENP